LRKPITESGMPKLVGLDSNSSGSAWAPTSARSPTTLELGVTLTMLPRILLPAEQAARERQAGLELDTARADYYRDLLGRGKELDDALELEGRAADAAAVAAVAAGDLTGAFTSWCAYNRSRRIRYQVRSRVQTAAHFLGINPYTEADLSQIRGSFADWLSGQEHLAIEGRRHRTCPRDRRLHPRNGGVSMAVDALDPGPDGNFPNLPRNPDGTLDTVRMPVGMTRQRSHDGVSRVIRLLPHTSDGRPTEVARCPMPEGQSTEDWLLRK
jgi:hypothetical protein